MAAKKTDQKDEQQSVAQAADEKKDETQAQTAENQHSNNPAQPADSESDSGNSDSTPTEKPSADEKAGKTVKGEAPDKDTKESVKMTLRHKSHTQHYYRCGLRLTKSFAEYDVPAASVVRIKADRWIEVKDGK